MSLAPLNYSINCYVALGENPTDEDNEHTSVSKFAIHKQSLSFGMISGKNLNFFNETMNELQNNIQLFRFDKCDTENLTQSKIVLSYIPSSLAFNDFIILSNMPFKNWIPQSMNNPPFLNDNNVLRNISVGLFEQIKQKDEQITSLKSQIFDKDTQITSLQSNLSKEHTMFIRYVRQTKDWTLNKLVEKTRKQLGDSSKKLGILNIAMANVAPIIFEITFTKDNGAKYIELLETRDRGTLKRELIVNVVKINATKYLSSCAPSQWICDKINSGRILFNKTRHNERRELYEPQISYIYSSGTINLKSKMKVKLPIHHYWTVL